MTRVADGTVDGGVRGALVMLLLLHAGKPTFQRFELLYLERAGIATVVQESDSSFTHFPLFASRARSSYVFRFMSMTVCVSPHRGAVRGLTLKRLTVTSQQSKQN